MRWRWFPSHPVAPTAKNRDPRIIPGVAYDLRLMFGTVRSMFSGGGAY